MTGEKSCVGCTKSFPYIEECYTIQGYAILYCLSSIYRSSFAQGYAKLLYIEPLHKTSLYRALGTQNFSYIQSPKYTKLLHIEPLDKTSIYRAPTQNFSYIQSPYTKTSIYKALGTENLYIQSPYTKLLFIEPQVRKTSTCRAPLRKTSIYRGVKCIWLNFILYPVSMT